MRYQWGLTPVERNSHFSFGLVVLALHKKSFCFETLLRFLDYQNSGKFNVCSKRVLLSWIKICRDFTLQTQIFTQKYRSWLRFYSEFLRKKLAAGGSVAPPDHHRQRSICRMLMVMIVRVFSIKHLPTIFLKLQGFFLFWSSRSDIYIYSRMGWKLGKYKNFVNIRGILIMTKLGILDCACSQVDLLCSQISELFLFLF